jgi:hypothetical protein
MRPRLSAAQRERALPPGFLSDPRGNGLLRSSHWPFDPSRYVHERYYHMKVLEARRNPDYASNWRRAARELSLHLGGDAWPLPPVVVRTVNKRRRRRYYRRR